MNDPPPRSVVSRRELLGVGAGSLAAAVLAGCSGSGRGGSANGSPAATAGMPLTQPTVLTSRDGRLDVTLRAEAGTVPYGDGRRFAYTYNGSSPGPTLRVRPGDKLTITLENRLDQPTNLHTHGLHVSPSGDADNVFVMVGPGRSHSYTYEIPADHRSGLNWYHPHHHGLVAPQLAGGLFGAIVVADALDDLPEVVGSTERVLVLSDPKIGDSASVLDAGRMEVMAGREGGAALVNGLLTPAIAAAAGSLERWRVLNASASRYYRLALEGHQLHVMATDGGRLARPVAVDDVLLAPGERVEVLVAPAAAGRHRLRTRGYDRGTPMGGGMMGGGMGGATGGGGSSGRDPQDLATLVVTGTAPAAALPTSLAPPSDLEAGTAGRERSFVLAMGMGGGGMGGMGGAMMSFTINGESFDATRTNVTAQLGTVEDWVLTNTSSMDHPFHLHAWPFQVVERSSGPDDLPGWKDTVNVPANATVRVRVHFADITGRSVYHCHILDHEDQGMMGTIEVS